MKKTKTVIGMVSILTASLTEISSCSNKFNGKGEVQLVNDGGKINDLSFIQQSWEGVKDFSSYSNITYSYKMPPQTKSEHEFINCYKAAISSEAKIIVATGYLQKNALIKYASNINKDIKFITVDYKINDNDKGYKKNNVAQICYKSEQSGFWAGIASCVHLNTESTKYMKNNELKIASFGGMDIESVSSYMFGFYCATVWWNKNLNQTALEIAKIIKPTIDKLYPVTNVTPKNFEAFSGTFKLTDGLIITEKLLNLGANIIFPVAGAQTQDVITKINSSNNKNIKIIGVDTDQSKMYVKHKALFLTSALKKIKKSITNTLKQWNKNNNDPSLFKEQENYGNGNEFVGIAQSSYITKELIEKIKTSLKKVTEEVSRLWDDICQNNNSIPLWERAMQKNIFL